MRRERTCVLRQVYHVYAGMRRVRTCVLRQGYHVYAGIVFYPVICRESVGEEEAASLTLYWKNGMVVSSFWHLQYVIRRSVNE
uniref:Uncharacterized protein n=1 Tax=Hordeum vulgare subsp. vulgare TaxID=112509 RepID=A0A8I6WVH3_HORVV